MRCACQKSREQERGHGDALSYRIRSRARLARRRATVPIRPRAQACERVDLSAQRATWRVPVPGQADCLLGASRGAAERYVVHIDADTFHALRLATSPVFPRPDSRDCESRAIVSGQRRQRDLGGDAERHGRRRRVTDRVQRAVRAACLSIAHPAI